MKFIVDNKVADVLMSSGWFFNRKINISHYVDALFDKGYFVNESAKEFLKSMGGLKIKHASYSNDDLTEEFFVDPLKPVSWLDPRWVSDCYNKIANEEICPIGVGFSEHMVIFISESGKMYGGYDDYFCLMGDTINKGLKNLFFDRSFYQLE
ncbi:MULTISPECIES: SUKH-3 domain-containing protein [unclassified Zymobacter]|uniref:SUKH-3 domain-containing protein n=1 Tax=unclassified Zymobacter TaxID=3048685 RepID=UPI0039C29E3D